MIKLLCLSFQSLVLYCLSECFSHYQCLSILISISIVLVFGIVLFIYLLDMIMLNLIDECLEIRVKLDFLRVGDAMFLLLHIVNHVECLHC